MTTVAYQAFVFAAGSTAFSTGNVEFALTLAEPPTIHGPVIRPLEGRTETVPWSLLALDASGAFTAQLADSGGRTDLVNRVLQVRRNRGGAGYAVIGGGRVSDITEESVGTYRVTVAQETAHGYDATIFNTTNTTRLYPPGPDRHYGPFAPPPKGVVDCLSYANILGVKMNRFRFQPGWVPLTDLGVEAIKRDVSVQALGLGALGNFQHVSLRIGNSTHRVVSFGSILSTIHNYVTAQFPQKAQPDLMRLTDALEQDYQDQKGPECWVVVSSSTQYTVSRNSANQSAARYSSAFLHMFSAPPSEGTPLHIGTSAGLHPMTLKRQIMTGSYASSGQARMRLSTAAFNTGSTGLERIPMPLVRFRITGPAQRGDWVARHLNAPYGVADLVDSSGKVTPRSVWLPATTGAFTFTFTGANLRRPHPTWLQPGGERVTEVRVAHTDEQWVIGGLAPGFVAKALPPTNAGSDFIRATPSTVTERHDRIGRLGIRSLTLEAQGVHPPIAGGIFFPIPAPPDPHLHALRKTASREIFERFGDGPIMGTLHGLSTCEAVTEGGWCRLTLGTYPNAGIGARGGTRLLQVLSKTILPDGVMLQYLDAGANLNALSAPTVTLALSSQNKKHTVKATVGSISTAGTGFQLDIANSNTTAAPGSTSQLWTRWQTSAQSAGTYLIGQRPAGSKTWARVRAAGFLRVRSSWRLSTAGITSSGLAAPSLAAVSNLTASALTMTWTPGEGSYPTQVFADTSTSASFSTGNLVANLGAGTKRFDLAGLAGNQKYLLGVRHRDIYGGVGTADSTTATTLSTASTANWNRCPAPGGLYLMSGSP